MKTYLKQPLVLFFLIIATHFSVGAQEQTAFYAEVFQTEVNTFEVELSLGNHKETTRSIDIYFYDQSDAVITIAIASLNTKDGNYFLFFNNIETQLTSNTIQLSIQDEALVNTPTYLNVFLKNKDEGIINTVTKSLGN